MNKTAGNEFIKYSWNVEQKLANFKQTNPSVSLHPSYPAAAKLHRSPRSKRKNDETRQLKKFANPRATCPLARESCRCRRPPLDVATLQLARQFENNFSVTVVIRGVDDR
ncbi:hypothetical protein Zmor_026555 [Zophobas morio]|uniref:Uncharacterized protein n=1 Tax=Zophobas morio TaxID=2755281 RepID=A0AA38HVW0_9CUCU|nr:hypothetical protein Zmor_026555 [Zophobas morio]